MKAMQLLARLTVTTVDNIFVVLFPAPDLILCVFTAAVCSMMDYCKSTMVVFIVIQMGFYCFLDSGGLWPIKVRNQAENQPVSVLELILQYFLLRFRRSFFFFFYLSSRAP